MFSPFVIIMDRRAEAETIHYGEIIYIATSIFYFYSKSKRSMCTNGWKYFIWTIVEPIFLSGQK